MNINKTTRLNSLALENYNTSKTFETWGVNFYSSGPAERTLEDVCAEQGLSLDRLISQLAADLEQPEKDTVCRGTSLDALIAYIVEHHHQYIKKTLPEILVNLDSLCGQSGLQHPEILEIRRLCEDGAQGLISHLHREEIVLFPYVRRVEAARAAGQPLPEFHCSTVGVPVSIMIEEHGIENERLGRIAILASGCEMQRWGDPLWKKTLRQLRDFELNLHRHIHLEDNLLFPGAMAMEAEMRKP
ncbi:MAG: hemerythrin domain-containing protein [Desulforhopalus sp.]|nr:hemerythrin domain-containing protein [Desulforhopalus sp.]